MVSIVVLFWGLAKSILRIPKGKPKRELQWRLSVRAAGQKGLRFSRVSGPKTSKPYEP